MSRTWSDEQISAFLDGELGAGETDTLARAMESDPALAARAERLASATRVFVAASGAMDAHPMPDKLKAVLAGPPTAKVIPFRGRSFAAIVTEHRAIAAALVCMAGAWGVVALGGPANDNQLSTGGMILASSPLHRALELTETGERVDISGDTSATPRLTFVNADGGYCRQFDLQSGDGVTTAIACREDGAWRTEVAVFGKAGPGGEYQTASGEKAMPLEAFIDRTISGDPLDAAAERDAISRRWPAAE